MGDKTKSIHECELENRRVMRKSIVAKVNISKGAQIEREMLDIRRPGSGIASKELHNIVGRRTNRNISRDTLIQWKDLE